MLSEEEKKAIDDLFPLTHINGYIDLYTKKEVKINTLTLSKWQNGVKVLLNLIETQQKEIEELKMKLEVEKTDNKYNQEEAWEEMIPRYKIKAKIEECREILYSFEKELELKANKDKFIHKESMNCLLGQISILQSLLEEE